MHRRLNVVQKVNRVARADTNVTEDLMKKARSDGFTGVYRDDRSPSVLMLEKMMAAANTRHFKSGTT